MRTSLLNFLLISGIGAGICCALPALAQTSAATDITRQSKERPLPPIRLPLGITDRPPYTEWKKHLGPAASALVRAEVTLRDDRTRETTIQSGVGLIVRCDGLVLLPSCLFRSPANGDARKRESVAAIFLQAQTAQASHAVTARPARSRTREAGPPGSFTADLPRFVSPDVPYVLVKVADKHFRGAALLHPRNVSAARSVEVIYLKGDSKAGPAGLTVETAKAQVTEKAEGGFALAFATAASAPPPSVPPGAIVIDTASNMAIGVYAPPDIASKASGSALTTFARVHDITNAIALVPEPDDRLGTAPLARKGGFVENGMVWVPGGPLSINPADFPELSGAGIACVPGFWIDRSEVTIGEYRKFLLATKHTPLPQGWADSDVTAIPAPPDPETGYDPSSLPVHGVSPEDARAYAAWAGKRLVTPLEWKWASLGAGLAPAEPVTLVPVAPWVSRQAKYDDETEATLNYLGNAQLVDVNKWIDTTLPPWTSAYERVLNAAEGVLRTAIAVSAYGEAKFWAYWQNPGNTFTYYAQSGSMPPGSQTPEFRTMVSAVSPSRVILDERLVATLQRKKAETPLPTQPNTHLSSWYYANQAMTPRLNALDDTQGMLMDMFDPVAIAPAGSRRYDRSIFDVRDVSTNLPEWIQENRALRPQERVAKILPPLFDPAQQSDWQKVFQSEVTRRAAQFHVALNGGDRFNPVAVRSNLAFVGSINPEAVFADTDMPWEEVGGKGSLPYIEFLNIPATTKLVLSRYPMPLLPFLSLERPEKVPDFGTGFRCAR